MTRYNVYITQEEGEEPSTYFDVSRNKMLQLKRNASENIFEFRAEEIEEVEETEEQVITKKDVTSASILGLKKEE